MNFEDIQVENIAVPNFDLSKKATLKESEHSNGAQSDTYDDSMDTETETHSDCDYLSHSEEVDIFGAGLDLKLNKNKNKTGRNSAKLSKNMNASKSANDIIDGKKKKKSQRLLMNKMNKIKLEMNGDENTNQRLRTQSNTINYLRLPINESEDEDALNLNNLSLPNNPKLHIRAYSESNIIQKQIQENQWPSTASSDDSFDADSASPVNSNVYSRYVSMKKKYKKQRRISKQFQEAITVIQDDNEEEINRNEEALKKHFLQQYEMKLIQLEHDKLNNALFIEDKMKHILSQNDELMLQNKQLQQQVATQNAMIQQQQQMVFQRMQSVDIQNNNNTPSPLSTMMHSPSTLNILRRVSSGFNIHDATKTNLGLKNVTSTTSMEDNYTLNDNVSVRTDSTNNSSVNVGDVHSKHNALNMEPPKKYKKKRAKKKKKKISKKKHKNEITQKLLQNDQEMMDKFGGIQTPWDRFVDLMTPSFCSCAPSQPIKKLLDTQ